ncbi:MAG: hypothetical protein Q4A44_02055 [Bacteroidales bacterium]|nr:hypothetical protein [Bacteroidales bacterium]
MREKNHYGIKITRTSDDDVTGASLLKAHRPKESYRGCVARVYRSAKEACEKNNRCKFLCDFSDMAGANSCTAAMMLAAAVTCAGTTGSERE